MAKGSFVGLLILFGLLDQAAKLVQIIFGEVSGRKQCGDHLRGMTSEQVAEATLRAIERGTYDVTLTLKGKLIVLVSRFFPGVFDFFARRKVRSLFADEIAERKRKKEEQQAVETK